MATPEELDTLAQNLLTISLEMISVADTKEVLSLFDKAGELKKQIEDKLRETDQTDDPYSQLVEQLEKLEALEVGLADHTQKTFPDLFNDIVEETRRTPTLTTSKPKSTTRISKSALALAALITPAAAAAVDTCYSVTPISDGYVRVYISAAHLPGQPCASFRFIPQICPLVPWDPTNQQGLDTSGLTPEDAERIVRAHCFKTQTTDDDAHAGDDDDSHSDTTKSALIGGAIYLAGASAKLLWKKKQGLPTSLKESVLDLATAAVGGAVLGGAGTWAPSIITFLMGIEVLSKAGSMKDYYSHGRYKEMAGEVASPLISYGLSHLYPFNLPSQLQLAALFNAGANPAKEARRFINNWDIYYQNNYLFSEDSTPCKKFCETVGWLGLTAALIAGPRLADGPVIAELNPVDSPVSPVAQWALYAMSGITAEGVIVGAFSNIKSACSTNQQKISEFYTNKEDEFVSDIFKNPLNDRVVDLKKSLSAEEETQQSSASSLFANFSHTLEIPENQKNNEFAITQAKVLGKLIKDNDDSLADYSNRFTLNQRCSLPYTIEINTAKTLGDSGRKATEDLLKQSKLITTELLTIKRMAIAIAEEIKHKDDMKQVETLGGKTKDELAQEIFKEICENKFNNTPTKRNHSALREELIKKYGDNITTSPTFKEYFPGIIEIAKELNKSFIKANWSFRLGVTSSRYGNPTVLTSESTELPVAITTLDIIPVATSATKQAYAALGIIIGSRCTTACKEFMERLKTSRSRSSSSGVDSGPLVPQQGGDT